MEDKLHTNPGFTFRRRGSTAASRTLIALHGSGAEETTMLPLARAIDSQALVLALRGRVDQDGERRWFLKHSPVEFDQESIRSESRALAAFLDGIYASGELDPARTIFLGYSNGGNLIHSTLMLHPDCISRAILLRCMPVLEQPPPTDLHTKRILIIAGEKDATYGPFAPALVQLLGDHGASTSFWTVPAGHEFGEQDIEIARQWLRAGEDGLPPVS